MFRRHKKENKTKLEHKLYLARENPEPIFDLSECDIRNVPPGIYSLCRVFLKHRLQLEHNQLSSLTGGGDLNDLRLLRVLDLYDNHFSTIPDEIELLVNLVELNLSDNHIKKLPASICNLKKLKILDVSNNLLKTLPDNIGHLKNLRELNVMGNSDMHSLPKSLCEAQRLNSIKVCSTNFVYPPSQVVEEGTEFIMKYICEDTGFTYVAPDFLEDDEENKDTADYCGDSFKAKMQKLDQIKEMRLQSFLEMERNNEMLQRKEFELATHLKLNKEKLLSHISEQQSNLELKISRLQDKKENEKFQLLEQLQEVEQRADYAIKQLFALNKEPQLYLLEQEKKQEEELLSAANEHNKTLQKQKVLNAMQEFLQQEAVTFMKYHESRCETAKTILEHEMQADSNLVDVLRSHGQAKVNLVDQLQEDADLQKALVGTLLERGDARSWGLVQQVRLVESQLATLTILEMDRQRLRVDEHLMDLINKRSYLSKLLMELLHQQDERRAQLFATLKLMEERNSNQDFWLLQYQQLLERMPSAITEAQNNMDPRLSQSLLMCGVLHCLPFLAHLANHEEEVGDVTEEDLKNVGIMHSEDRRKVLDAFQMYLKLQTDQTRQDAAASAPILNEASAPMTESVQSPILSECVICMENNCEIIFVPCGHLCCCINCSNALKECPMCRGTLEHKIRVYIQ